MTLGRLVDGLRERNHLVHVIRAGDSGSGQGETVFPSVNLPGYNEVKVGLPNRLKLHARWKRKRPDVIYVATESPLGHSAVKAANSLGIPTISGFHTNFHQYMEDYRLSGLQPAAMKYLRKLHNRTQCTLAPSADVREMLMGEGFKNVELLGRGVDTDRFSPAHRDKALRAKFGAEEGDPLVLMVGRVAAEKNLSLGIDAFELIRRKHPRAQCVVVGDGPLRSRLELSHPDLHFVGAQRGSDLSRLYASADLLLFPSETETFGNVLLEGMASGLVSVAYDYAAAANFIDLGLNGFKVPKGDEEGFLQMSVRAVNLIGISSFREAARETVMPHSWSEVVDTLESHLQRVAQTKPRVRGKHGAKKAGLEVETLIISDVHLGTPDSKVREVIDVIKHVKCRKLILNGDIVDGWALKRGSAWQKTHTRFVRAVLKKMEKEACDVIYLRGNHDDILDRFLPMKLDRLSIVKEHIHSGMDGNRYLVVHGDGFDTVSTNHKWLAVVGSVGYDWLLRFNRGYNRYRAWMGKEYYSVSKAIKARVKGAVSFVDRYEEQLQKLAEHRKCQGIICGHIHTPADKSINGVRYLNSGDWVESLTAIFEHADGRFEVVGYDEICRRLQAQKVTESGPVLFEDTDLEEDDGGDQDLGALLYSMSAS